MKMIASEKQLEVGVSLDTAVNEVSEMVAALVALREADISFARTGIEAVVNYCKGAHPIHANNVEVMGHRLRQKGSELFMFFLLFSRFTEPFFSFRTD